MRRAKAWLAVLVVGLALGAAAPPANTERDKLLRQAAELNSKMQQLYAEGKFADSFEAGRKALEIRQRLYPAKDYPDGHPDLASSLVNLGTVLAARGETARSLRLSEQALEMTRKLTTEAQRIDGNPSLALGLNNVAASYGALGELEKALEFYRQALDEQRKLYPPSRFPDGHPNLAIGLNNYGMAVHGMGEPAKALPPIEQGLEMRQKLYPKSRFPDGHLHLGISLTNMGFVLTDLGEVEKALPYYEKSLAMFERLYPESAFPNGHPYLMRSLDNLGGLLNMMGEPARALPPLERARSLYQKFYPASRFKDGHPEMAVNLNNIGYALRSLGRPAEALPVMREALGRTTRLYPESRFKDGHPRVASALNSLAATREELGENDEALALYSKALDMRRRLYPESRFKDGHRLLALSLNNVGGALRTAGRPAESLDHYEKALAMQQRLAARELAFTPEDRALSFLRSLPRTRDGYLTTAARLPAAGYGPVYGSRANFLRLVLQRHEAARAAVLESAEARDAWRELGEVRRRVGRLLSEPGQDLAARDRLLATLEETRGKLERDLAKHLPQTEQGRRLAGSTPEALAARLPARAAFLDAVRYKQFGVGKDAGWRYVAFVVTSGRPAQRVELGDADEIDRAIASWRASIDKRESSLAPAALRKLVWGPIEKELPAGTATVYLQLDGELARLPFAALPGRKPGSVLLEEYAFATVPAGAWLSQRLEKPAADGDGSLLALGGLEFGAAPAGRVAFPPLKETDRELRRVLEAFRARPEEALRGASATAKALRQRLPRATVAHLATHAYYDAGSLEAEYGRLRKQREQWTLTDTGTARAGLGARNPLGFVGLVLAGGNDPSKAADGGGLTGLEILELPLEKMRLCVLSACETGLGRWDELAGVSGLQMAFHVAGCRDVVGSLWSVNDAATAALMTQFYHEWRVNKKPPLEALRQAQLTIYHHPERIPDLAGDRGRPALEKAAALGTGRAPAPAAKGKKADTKLWAAFVLSGPGD